MALPEQVRRQAERANELFDQVNAAPGEPPQAAPVAAPPEVQQAVELQNQPAAPPAADPPAAPAPSVENWEHKYKTLQGVLAANKRDADATIQTLQSKIATMAAAPPAPAPAPPAPAPLVTDKDLETYGADMLDLIRRQATEMAQKIVAEQMAQLKPELDQTRDHIKTVEQQVYQNEGEKFYGELAKAVPDWEAINQDPRFLNWLGEVDPLSGVERQGLLESAGKKLDHKRVATIFELFKTEAGLNKPAPAPAAPAPGPSPSPRTVGNAPPVRSEPVTSVKRSEIQAHYRRGSTDASYRGSDEYKATEVRIQQALATNQVLEA